MVGTSLVTMGRRHVKGKRFGAREALKCEFRFPQLAAGKNILIAAYGNSLRSIIMYLDKLTCKEVISLELSTGIPLLYIFKDGKFMKRGSPVCPTEAGVYAYTKVKHRFYCSTIFIFFEFSVLDGSLCLQRLAQYRQKLDDESLKK
ncbi:hypothetical protein F2Q70_00042848 [Brassica cretica]|uniref:Uncharacterized protein n=1 Tax=Brassica cretica TaxID=69181 RepID=A0A8S9KFL8_BRACR|nr:hypothetical protein F2Q70_00042848 [Brassica cretica]